MIWRIGESDKFSFPSGHTAAAFVMATLLSYFFPDIVNTVVFLGLVGGIFPHLSWCPLLSHGYTGGANHRPAQCLDRTIFLWRETFFNRHQFFIYHRLIKAEDS